MSKLGFIGIIMIALMIFNPIHAQSNTVASQNEKTIKGLISDEEGPLESVSIILKGTKSGTATNKKGEFTFPKKLKVGDVLVISYLGYGKQDYKIEEDTTFIKIILSDDLVEIIGDLATDKPYKSKRKN